MRHPLVAQFDGKPGLREQFVLLLAESARPGLGFRTLVDGKRLAEAVADFRARVADDVAYV
ncbi:hypothetical protein GCT13_44460 [Paraburkholderia sp. CNPSo 3157]|uniref:Uncharacterized protein n=1 Tax=Paraburkholderia franconis TaxID=2654983 RepID=A0A7X1NKK8_9BURK|nr:hypothetical protein [Paraburkholderia franconis]MPW23589.1 hypothetical protein [Paraburkholderia franconis]